MTNPNDPAFPATIGADGYGLTKREYFAALAMQAITMSDKGWMNKETKLVVEMTPAKIAVLSIDMADALIVELNK